VLTVSHTADLPPSLLAGSRALLEASFDDWEDDDWEHSLGGVHAVVTEGTTVLAHGAVVMRRMVHAGAALRCGYVEGVAVAADRRREGHGSAVMAALERIVASAYDLGALGSTDEGLPFYGGRGWQPWRGPLSALTPDGVVATPDELGWVLVLPGPAVPLDLDGPLVCDWRDGDVW
jgi:aminoglycoside 2'-N-acetyltransferase I